MNGYVFGNYDITLAGSYLNLTDPTVTIDKIPCIVKYKDDTQIVCTVGERLTLPDKVSF